MKETSAMATKRRATPTQALPSPRVFRDVAGVDAADSSLTKGERTRSRLLQAAFDVFREDSFHAARVSDICKAAEISQGTFYIYFTDKDAIAKALMEMLLERLTRHVLDGPHFDDPFDSILESNRRYADFFNQGGQFNRAVLQILDALPEVRELSDKVNKAVAARVSEGMKRRMPASAAHPKPRLAMAYTMLGMIDSIYISYFSGDASPMRACFASTAELVEFASFVWYRALFGTNPPRRASSELLSALDGFVMPPASLTLRSRKNSAGA